MARASSVSDLRLAGKPGGDAGRIWLDSHRFKNYEQNDQLQISVEVGYSQQTIDVPLLIDSQNHMPILALDD